MGALYQVTIDFEPIQYAIEADSEEAAYDQAEELLREESNYELTKYSKMLAERIEREDGSNA